MAMITIRMITTNIMMVMMMMKISTQVASMSLLAKLHWLTSQLAQVVANTIIEFVIIIINIITSP